MGRVLLLRHGETDWNRVDRIQGWSDISLNAHGRRQAHAAAGFLGDRHPDLNRLVSSDLPRAAETAEAVAATDAFAHLDVEADPAWRERDFGVYQGQKGDQFFEENPEFAMLDGHDDAKGNVPEDGESYLAFRDRVRSAWDDLRTGADGTVLVVTHSGVIRALIAAIEESPIEDVFYEFDVENGSVTEVVVGGEPHLEEVNHVGHLPSRR